MPITISAPRLPHPVIEAQIAGPQPPIVLLLVAYLVPAHLLTWMTQGLMHWPSFVQAVADHHDLYFGCFFGLQIACVVGIAGVIGWRYRSALWQPKPRWRSAVMVAWLMLMPLLCYHAQSMGKLSDLLDIATRYGRNPVPMIDRTFYEVWNKLAYGSSLEGVWYSSILSFTAPVLEEILFTGCLLNAIGRQWGIWLGIFGTAILFCLSHGAQFGFGFHLWPLFFAGLTYTAIRVVTGSLWMSVAAHLLINTIVFLPKWGLALFHFRHM